MECPLCTQVNFDGTDNCSSCGADLTYLGKLPAENDIERELLTHPLRKLACEDYVVVEPQTTVDETLTQWREAGVHCAMVVENDGLVGIFTERDVLYRIIDRGRNPATLPLQEVMTRSPDTLLARASVAFVLNRMAVGGFRHVPVVDEQGHPVAIVSVRDVVEFLVDHFPREVMNLPPEVGGNITRSREGA